MEAVYLILILGGMLAQFFYFRSLVTKSLREPESLKEVRKEVDALITELNQNADRNLTLMEQRLGQIQQVLSEADKRLVLLKKEESKAQTSTQIYSHLQKAKVLVPPMPPAPSATEAPVPEPAAPPVQEKSPPTAGEPKPKSTAQKVKDLAQDGKDAPQIARALGITLGEVELILSLQKGSQG